MPAGRVAGIGGLGAAFEARAATVTAGRLRGVPGPLAARLGHAVAQWGIGAASGVRGGLRPSLVGAAQHGMTTGLHTVELLGALGALAAVAFAVAVARVGRRALSS